MKIAITGTSGFIGKNLLPYLETYGDEVRAVSRTKEGFLFTDDEHSLIYAIIHLAGKAHDLKNVSSPQEYYHSNTALTKQIFDYFLQSEAEVFIFMSSVKAAADVVPDVLTEDFPPNPQTHYGKSKLRAEEYILQQALPAGKRVYILRPCMIHGPGNKGNLNLLYKIVSKGLPWPLGAFENRRSFCSIYNLCFVIRELLENKNVPSGIYNVADDEALSTNQLVSWIAQAQNKKAKFLRIPKRMITSLSKIGDILRLPLNSERLQKLTENYIVSNEKIRRALGKSLPVSAREGLEKTIQSLL